MQRIELRIPAFAIQAAAIVVFGLSALLAPEARAQDDAAQTPPIPLSPLAEPPAAGDADGGTIRDSATVALCLCGSQEIAELTQNMMQAKRTGRRR